MSTLLAELPEIDAFVAPYSVPLVQQRIASLLDFALYSKKVYSASGRRISLRVNEKGRFWCQVWAWPHTQGGAQLHAIGRRQLLFDAVADCCARLDKKVQLFNQTKGAFSDPLPCSSGAAESYLQLQARRIERLLILGAQSGKVAQLAWDGWMLSCEAVFGETVIRGKISQANKLTILPQTLDLVEQAFLLPQ